MYIIAVLCVLCVCVCVVGGGGGGCDPQDPPESAYAIQLVNIYTNPLPYTVCHNALNHN